MVEGDPITDQLEAPGWRDEILTVAPDAVTSSSSRGAAGLSVDADSARALHNMFKLGGTLLATAGMSLAVRLVIPEILGPATFGLYSFADSFSTTGFVLLTLGIDQYIHKEIPLRPAHASDFFAGVTTFRWAGAILISLAMWGILVATQRDRWAQGVVLIFAALQFFSLDNDSMAALLHAANRIDGLTIANVVTKAAWGGLMLGLALRRSNVLFLAGATLGLEVVRSGWLWMLARRNLGLRWRIDLGSAHTVLRASMPFFVSTVAQTAYSKVDATTLAFLSSDTEVGYYGVGCTFGMLTLVLTPLISWVLMPLSARAASRSRKELMALMENLLRVILSLAIPLALALFLGADDLLRLLYQSKYRPSALTLRILAPLFVVTYVAILAATTLIRLDRAWTVTAISLLGLVVTPVLSVVLVGPVARAFGAGGAAGGAALALLATELVVSTAMLISLRGEILSRAVRRSLVAGLLCAGATVVVDHLLTLGLGACRYPVDALTYLGLAVASGSIQLGELRRILASGLLRRRQA